MFISDMSYFAQILMLFILKEEVFRKEKKNPNHGDHGVNVSYYWIIKRYRELKAI